ncbi:MAG: class I SAM-dependent rRNA methyltransferase, partial [Planctomycetota bacterium]
MSQRGEQLAGEAPPAAQSPWVQLRSASHHPFVYRKMIGAEDPAARAGDIVNVYDKAGRLFGRGLYNPHSQIVVRMLAWGAAAIDTDFWRARLEQAVALRRLLRLDEGTDAYRLVHAEGDGLTGLIVERYADVLAFEFFSKGMFQRHAELAGLLAELLGPPAALDRPDRAGPQWHMVFRADQRIERLEKFRLPARPPAPERVTIREHGLRYRVDLKQGHKTGFFCDQRDNRRRLADLCRDATVLDLCCYTGGFSLCAARLGGAREVTGVDLDEAAVALARENANLNQTRVDFVYADAFTYMRQMHANARQFDVVVLDPPKLVTYRPELDDGLRKYHDLNHLAVQMVRPGGVLVTCSCSGLVAPAAFTEAVYKAAQR